jgi:hypothetical protein
MSYNLQQHLENIENSNLVIALDFDGVIHNDCLGFNDGTIYGEPIEGVEYALDTLSKKYKLIIFSCKSNPKRPLINEKTGTELIWDWLEKWNLKSYVSDVVWGKPNAIIYIDDKGLRFSNWNQTITDLKSFINI